ncbi:MAG: hypothetical protein OEM62_06250 [Acidobacteriota bacterium]|nr:hypothetical protein [Acidobacteriota bacterium]
MTRQLSLLLTILLVPTLTAAQGTEPVSECDVFFTQSPRPLNVASFFTWYHFEDQFDCMSARPLEGWFLSSDRRRTKQHFHRLRKHGFDALLTAIYADPESHDGGSSDMRHMVRALEIARQQKLQFIPLFDLAVAADLKGGFCNRFAGLCPQGTRPIDEYNFDRHPELERLTVDMMKVIAERFILPFTHPKNPTKSTARYLTDNRGRLVLDEHGLPRPEIYLYIARVWTDDSRDHKTIKTTLRKVNRAYHRLGLGKPAYTLDVIQANNAGFDEGLVAAFGDTVVGITSFFEPHPQARTMGELTRTVHGPMYANAATKLARAIGSDLISPRVQVSVGTAANFDKRRWAACNGGFGNVAWPAMGPEEVFEAFLGSITGTTQPEHECKRFLDTNGNQPVPYRNKRFIYAGEGFEGTWLCAETQNGQFVYPNRYGCQPLHIFEALMKDIGELRTR